jgi:hypothetical protein
MSVTVIQVGPLRGEVPGSVTEIIPGKHPHTIIKPLPLTNGQRNIYLMSVSILKPPCGGFRSETATWIQKWFKMSAGTFK